MFYRMVSRRHAVAVIIGTLAISTKPTTPSETEILIRFRSLSLPQKARALRLAEEIGGRNAP